RAAWPTILLTPALTTALDDHGRLWDLGGQISPPSRDSCRRWTPADNSDLATDQKVRGSSPLGRAHHRRPVTRGSLATGLVASGLHGGLFRVCGSHPLLFPPAGHRN